MVSFWKNYGHRIKYKIPFDPPKNKMSMSPHNLIAVMLKSILANYSHLFFELRLHLVITLTQLSDAITPSLCL